MQRKLPSELGAADPKTVGRLMKIMHEKKLASDGIVVNIPPAKSSLGFCQPREVVVYTAYDSKVRHGLFASHSLQHCATTCPEVTQRFCLELKGHDCASSLSHSASSSCF